MHGCALEIDGQSRGGVLRVRGLLRGSSIAMAWGGGGSVKRRRGKLQSQLATPLYLLIRSWESEERRRLYNGYLKVVLWKAML